MAVLKVHDGDKFVTIPQRALGVVFDAGMMLAYGDATAPEGWLVCDGSTVSRTTFSDLFDVIGTDYGTGNGTTTFTLPDMRGVAAIGVS